MPLIVFLASVLAGVVIFLCVARKYVWGPRAVDRELVRQLQAAGIETRILRKPRLSQRFPLAREWITPLPVEQAGASLREKLNAVPGLEVDPQTDGGLVVHSRQKQSLRGGPPHEITFAEARFAFDSQGVSGTRIRCEVKFEVSQALLITVVVALAFAGRFLLFARPGAVELPYWPAILAALVSYVVIYGFALWPGQLILTQTFLDRLILESLRRP